MKSTPVSSGVNSENNVDLFSLDGSVSVSFFLQAINMKSEERQAEMYIFFDIFMNS